AFQTWSVRQVRPNDRKFCRSLAKLPARAPRGVFHDHAGRGELVSNGVGRREILARPRRFALLERHPDEGVHYLAKVVAMGLANPWCRERMQAENSEHCPDFGKRLRGSGDVACGNRRVPLPNAFMHDGQRLWHAKIIIKSRSKLAGNRSRGGISCVCANEL